jgi:hypothetical protein
MKTAIAYGLGPEDPAWLILAINQTGLIGMEKTIHALAHIHEKEIAAFDKRAQQIAGAAMDKAAQDAIQQISHQLATTTESLYRKRIFTISSRWTVATVAAGMVLMVGISVFMYQFIESSLYQKAFNDAYLEVNDEKARASWANTPKGKFAFELSRTTDIEQIARCKKDGSGWVLSDDGNVCYPNVNSDGIIHGWGIPKFKKG